MNCTIKKDKIVLVVPHIFKFRSTPPTPFFLEQPLYETYKKQQQPKSIAKYQSIQILFVSRKSDMLC